VKNSTRILKVICLQIFFSFACIAAVEVPPEHDWSFKGPFGVFDRAQLQRGFQVYKEVCQACHSLNQISYRNLEALGFSSEEVKAIAREAEVRFLGPDGEMTQRPATPADRFVDPFPTKEAAREANNGALPPDLSLITKARHQGADYVFAFLTGYQEPPADFKLNESLYYNRYFSGFQTAMPVPLQDGIVTYADGTAASVDQMASDVVAFLSWTSEPEMESRKRNGIMVLLYLFVFVGFLYVAMKRIWSRILHHSCEGRNP
jgi:ubiquinol-cytochrome c reductase cytochrome c1 subunit